MNLETLRHHKMTIFALAEKRGIENIRVFGSTVRGQATSESDVDFLVHVREGRSLLDLAGFEQDVSELLHVKADVLDDESIKERLCPYILGEAVSL